MTRNLDKKNTSVAVTVVHSTDKAVLVQDAEGRKAWLQNRWLRDGRTVAAATFERAAASFAAAEVAKEARKNRTDPVSVFRDGWHKPAVVRESEKAVGCHMVARVTASPDEAQAVLVWFPKSRLDEEGRVQGWMLITKAEEKLAELQGGKNHFKLMAEAVGGVELPQTLYSKPAGGW